MISVRLELVTPAFAGGADSSAVDTLRPPTIKSLLRWWWRTKHPQWNTEQLYNAEAVIWGSAPFRRSGDAQSRPPRGGQGTRLIPDASISDIRLDADPSLEDRTLRYLAFGAMAPEGEQMPERPPRLPVATKLNFRLVPPLRASRNLLEDLYHALWLFSTFGGVGQRSRRGWGSVRVATDFPEGLPDPHTSPDPVDAITRGLARILGDRNQLPAGDLTLARPAFSRNSRVLVGPPRTSWDRALTLVGGLYFDYHKALGSGPDEAGPDCKKRRGWRSALSGATEDGAHPIEENDRELPRGSAFGLPHNAYFKREEQTLKIGVGEDLGGRRASPLFISVVGSGESFRPVVLWLAGRFLPEDLVPHAAVDQGRAFPLQGFTTSGVREFIEGATDLGWTGLATRDEWRTA